LENILGFEELPKRELPPELPPNIELGLLLFVIEFSNKLIYKII
jgi:hypothetical protein